MQECDFSTDSQNSAGFLNRQQGQNVSRKDKMGQKRCFLYFLIFFLVFHGNSLK